MNSLKECTQPQSSSAEPPPEKTAQSCHLQSIFSMARPQDLVLLPYSTRAERNKCRKKSAASPGLHLLFKNSQSSGMAGTELPVKVSKALPVPMPSFVKDRDIKQGKQNTGLQMSTPTRIVLSSFSLKTST